jgi:hypothetical protein
MPVDDLCQLEIQLHRFNKLMSEVIRRDVVRNSFLPWEVEILMDMENCALDRRRRMDILKQYQRAVGKQMERGPGPPMKLSHFLELRSSRQNGKSSQPEAEPALLSTN